MPFLSSQSIKKRLNTHVVPYDASRVKHSAYELSLGREAYITSDENKRVLEPGNILTIHPGQFALLLTEEEVRIPEDHIAFISIKASQKFKGLVNVSGFHVDPGFAGHLKFSVYNAGSRNIRIESGSPLFLIWFARLDERVEDPYDGHHNRQTNISAKDITNIEGDIVSPPVLKERLENLKVELHKIEHNLSREIISAKNQTKIFVAIASSILALQIINMLF